MKQTFTHLLLLALLPAAGFAQTLTWSSEIPVANESTYGSLRPRITVASGNVPLVMWGGGSMTEPLYVARGNGSTFNSPATVTPNGVDPAIMTWSGPDIAANGNTVYVVLKREPEMSNNIYILKSTDGGVTWSDTTRVDGMTGPYDRFPTVAVTQSGNPAVMFMTFDMSWGNAAYAVTNSTDGGLKFEVSDGEVINLYHHQTGELVQRHTVVTSSYVTVDGMKGIAFNVAQNANGIKKFVLVKVPDMYVTMNGQPYLVAGYNRLLIYEKGQVYTADATW